MKRLKTILLFLVICISCFGQKNASKFDDLIISESFTFYLHTDVEEGDVWFPSSYILEEEPLKDIEFNIAIDKKSGFYYCIVNIFSKVKYYSIDNQTLPHLLLKTDDGKLVYLKADKDEPVQFEQQLGEYITKLIFFIPDIREFESKNCIECRVWLRDEFYSDFYAFNFNFTGSQYYNYSDIIVSREKEVTSKYKKYKENLEWERRIQKIKEEEIKKKEEFRKEIKERKINDPFYNF